MKRKFYYGMTLGFALLALAGCGDKKEKKDDKKSTTQTLECTVNEDGGKAKTQMVYDQSKKEFISVSFEMSLELPEESLSIINADSACDMFSEEDAGATNCKASLDGNLLTMSYDMDMDKLEEDEDSGFKRTMTIEEAKKSAEDEEGATCVIK